MSLPSIHSSNRIHLTECTKRIQNHIFLFLHLVSYLMYFMAFLLVDFNYTCHLMVCGNSLLKLMNHGISNVG